MDAELLERLIKSRAADIERHHANSENERSEARQAAADVAALHAMRSPETVREMEQARGLG